MQEAVEQGPPPIQRVLAVPLPVEQAFDLFVRRLPEWWPLKTRSVWGEQAVSCHVEPHLGGRLFERNGDGEESCWGTFLTYEAPARVVFSWHPGSPASLATEVEIAFSPIATGTALHLEHRAWERLGENASFFHGLVSGGWGPILARFEALARGEADLPQVTGWGCIDAKDELERAKGG
jgi:uncharacterized protein YndB with AHSA1/START domain